MTCWTCCSRAANPRASSTGPRSANCSSSCAAADAGTELIEGTDMKLAHNKATLSFSNGSPNVELPVYRGTIGPDVIDIRKLYAQTGMFTYDPGFMSTAACQSTITYIDGDKGELLYRGYPIEQLATQCDFLETCHLLLYGELPDAKGKQDFTDRVTMHTMVNEQMQFFLRGFRRDAHP